MSYYGCMPPNELFIKRLRNEFSVAPDVQITPETDFYELIGNGRQEVLEQLQKRMSVQIGTAPDKAADFFNTGMQAEFLGEDKTLDSGAPNTVGRLSAMIDFIHERALPDNGSS